MDKTQWVGKRACNTYLVVLPVLLMACSDAAVAPGWPVSDVTGQPASTFVPQYTAWSAPISVELIPGTHSNFNTVSTEGCPFGSPDGRTFFMASNRPGGLGGLDIWVSTRNAAGGWDEPVNVGAPVNSSADDFCPTMTRDGHLFYFVSRRAGGCGLGDIYVTRLRDGHGFDEPELLPCDDTAPYDAVNSPFDEFSPFPVEERGTGPALYFSSFRPGGYASEAAGASPDSDIYWSISHGGVFGAVALVDGVNSTADDGQPNVGRDGLELFFYSTRVDASAQGSADLYASTRSTPFGPWGTPVNLGAPVNSAGGESRPSLSWDGTTLYFGSTKAGGEGASDIYVTTRQRLAPGAP